jgi:uncharacterized protein YcbK (DUF882 family)
MSNSRKRPRTPKKAARRKSVARADRSLQEITQLVKVNAAAPARLARGEVRAAPREEKRPRPPAAAIAAPRQKAQRSKVLPALILAFAVCLMALGLLQPISEHSRGQRVEKARMPPVEAKVETSARAVEVAAESDVAPAQLTFAGLRQLVAPTAPLRQEARLPSLVLSIPELPAISVLSTPPSFETPASHLQLAGPAELKSSAILVPEAGKLLAKMLARKAGSKPSEKASEAAPLASAAIDVEWLMSFATPDEVFIDPTAPSVPMLLPEPPPGWQLGAIATLEASIPSRKRVSFVDFAMRPVPLETGERYVPEAAPRSEGYAVHPPQPTLELPDSQRLREIILAHETARKARIATAAKAKAIAAERAAMNSIEGKSIACLPSAIKQVLFDLTRLFGPVHVNSSYRSPSHNRNVGGASRSLHMECRAVDFRVAGNQQRVMKYITSRSEVGGYKHYGGHIHIDNGPRRTW